MFVGSLPEPWPARVERLAGAVRKAGDPWHVLFLALAGALLQRGCPGELLVAVVRAVSVGTRADTRTFDREAGARSTLEARAAGRPLRGYGDLRRRWPEVADAVDEAFAIVGGVGGAVGGGAAAGMAGLEEAFRRAPDGLSIVTAECGMGKTRAAGVVAAERARRSGGGTGARAPWGSKTAIAVDKTELAIQVAENIRGMGVDVARLFGPLSVEGDGACIHRKVALPLVAGGQSLARDFCEGRHKERCERYDVCGARRGFDGPAGARVLVGPHGLLPRLDEAAGTTGLLVIDEPPPLLGTTAIDARTMGKVRDHLPNFTRAYREAMRPILEALEAWMLADEGEAAPDLAALGAAVPDVPRPPIEWLVVHRLRSVGGDASGLGMASRVLGIVARGLRSVGAGATMAVVERKLLVTVPDELLAMALRREGSVVVADANADLHAPLYARVVGYEPPVTRFAAGDGAPIRRTLFRTRASRSAWLRGEVRPAAFYAALEHVLAWAGGEPLALITFKALLEDEGVRGRLAGYAGGVATAHYGGTRGLDRMKDFGCLATLGDPRPNLHATEREATFAGLDWEPRLEGLARAELEQAHGRIRAVHRTVGARVCHVGQIWPGGWGWTPERVEVVDLARVPRASSVSVDEVRERVEALAGVAGAAKAWGVSVRTVQRYLAGAQAFPGSFLGITGENQCQE